jgi:hypothetical protein
MIRGAKLAAAVIVIGACATGCVVEQTDDADRFREAIPQSDDVALRVPGASGAGARAQGLRIATSGGGAADASAKYYRFTRDITRAVDGATAVILGGIWAIVHTPPTTVSANQAVWGPGQSNALEPVVWRFTVTEVGAAEYDYVLEGQPKGGSGFTAVLRGHGYGKSRPEHRTGWFLADNDAFRTLDPDHAKDEGTTKVTFDLTAAPATIAVELKPGVDRGWANVLVTHEAGGAGSVAIEGLGDIDDTKSTQHEDIDLRSRWTTTGSGRADVRLAGGDLPFTVNASECWSSSFARVYYKDTVDYEAPSGDATSCALPASTF